MALVSVVLPSMLVHVAGCARESSLEAETLEDALARLVERHPSLGVHLFDESGSLRQHVLCIHNDENSRWRRDPAECRLADGDTIRILQAVSGG